MKPVLHWLPIGALTFFPISALPAEPYELRFLQFEGSVSLGHAASGLGEREKSCNPDQKIVQLLCEPDPFPKLRDRIPKHIRDEVADTAQRTKEIREKIDSAPDRKAALSAYYDKTYAKVKTLCERGVLHGQ